MTNSLYQKLKSNPHFLVRRSVRFLSRFANKAIELNDFEGQSVVTIGQLGS